MKNYLGRMVLLVRDYDEALTFYQTNFGCKILFDKKTETGGRYLHIGFEATDSIGIWFLKADAEEEQKLVGNQTGGQPTLIIYTDELHELHKHLVHNNVTIRIGPIDDADYSFFHCYDLYENEILVVQLHPHEHL